MDFGFDLNETTSETKSVNIQQNKVDVNIAHTIEQKHNDITVETQCRF